MILLTLLSAYENGNMEEEGQGTFFLLLESLNISDFLSELHATDCITMLCIHYLTRLSPLCKASAMSVNPSLL